MRGALLRRWRSLSVALLCLAIGGYVVTGLVIGRQVDRTIGLAQSRYAQAPVEALISLALSEEAPLRDRNRAVWALGQLGAREAAPALRSLELTTGCDHESAVCQHELKKALDLCSGALNIGALVWRHGELAVR